MAKTFGFANATEFAFVVEGWTQKQRTDCLERFYLKRKERLAEMDKESGRVESVYDTTADLGVDTSMDLGVDDGETDDDEL
jgi:hypothetical protein